MLPERVHFGLSISSSGPRMNGKDREKKQYVGLSCTET